MHCNRFCLSLMLLLFFGCSGSEKTEPHDTGPKDGGSEDASSTDAQPKDAADGGTTDGTTADAGDAGCSGNKALRESCNLDCECQSPLVCRGLQGHAVCSIACAGGTECDGQTSVGCSSPFCDLVFGACRCSCVEEPCTSGNCFASYCVGCATDDHCRNHSCTSPAEPRCRRDTGECVCGGTCGDGTCDDFERSLGSCPKDCTGPCEAGETIGSSCWDGQRSTWCTCDNASWSCSDPTTSCTGDTECQRLGGSCVSSANDCYEGAIDAEAHECSGSSALCCLPTDCTTEGESYYPMSGTCCPGLRALPDANLMTNWMPGVDGIMCATNCWALHCAPCGDGSCQPHFGENFCSCPEDCDKPTYPLVCDQQMGCGEVFCHQEPSGCVQERPRCDNGTCVWDTETSATKICSSVTRTCETI